MNKDTDELLAEVRARIKAKRDRGVYGPEVDAALSSPLPGGALLSEDLEDPIRALEPFLESESAYDPTSRKPLIGSLITLARRTVIWLARWWIFEITRRQDHVNRLVLRAIRDLDERSSPRITARVSALEEARAREQVRERAEHMDYELFAERFGGLEAQVRAQAERFVPRFVGASRVLDVGSGRGVFLKVARERGIGAYGIDLSAPLVERCRAEGLEVYRVDAEEHLRGLPDSSLDGIFAVHFAEHVVPGHLFEILRECKRVLRPGAYLVMATPNPRTLTVGAHTFWIDPSHTKPLPPESLQFYLQISGFEPVTVETYNPSEERLSVEGLSGALLENTNRLNATLYGDRDYAVIGKKP